MYVITCVHTPYTRATKYSHPVSPMDADRFRWATVSSVNFKRHNSRRVDPDPINRMTPILQISDGLFQGTSAEWLDKVAGLELGDCSMTLVWDNKGSSPRSTVSLRWLWTRPRYWLRGNWNGWRSWTSLANKKKLTLYKKSCVYFSVARCFNSALANET